MDGLRDVAQTVEHMAQSARRFESGRSAYPGGGLSASIHTADEAVNKTFRRIMYAEHY